MVILDLNFDRVDQTGKHGSIIQIFLEHFRIYKEHFGQLLQNLVIEQIYP